MLKLEGLKIKTTTYPESFALQSFYSYTLENTPFYFNIIWSPLKTEEYKKQFTNTKIIWDFGDGTTYTGSSAQHSYTWPGIYTVKATLLDVEGNTTELFADEQLVVYNAIPDLVTMGGLDNNGVVYALPAGRRTPALKFYRYNSWQYDKGLSNNNYTVNLYASGSNSSYISVSSYYTSQWSHLKSYFGFIERTTTRENVLSERLIDSTITTSTSVYAERVNTGRFDGNWNVRLAFYSYPKNGTVFCGTSGTELSDREIFFVDQKPSSQDKDGVVILYASIDNRVTRDISFYNTNLEPTYGIVNNTWVGLVIKSLYNSASSLYITSNGITFEGGTDRGPLSAQSVYSFDIYPIKYTNTKIPFTVTLKDNENYTTKCYPLLNLNNTDQLKINDVKVSLVEVFKDGSTKELSDAFVENNNSVPRYANSGSYCSGILSYPYEVTSAAISAVAFIKDEPFIPPSKAPAFIMQPGTDLYRRIDKTYKYGYHLFKDTFSVSEGSQISTYSGNISGGISIAYVPGYLISPLSGEYVWITNADRDRVIVHDGFGGTRFTIDLRKFILRSKRPNGSFGNTTVTWRGPDNSSSPCGVAVNSNGDAWITMYDSVTSYKFEKTTGVAVGIIKPPLPEQVLDINLSDNIFYTQAMSYKGFVGENLILPTSVDVDKGNNVYISYTHPLCSFISKYTDGGNLIEVYPFNFPFTVKQILVDVDNNVWATTFSNESIEGGSAAQTQRIVDRRDRVYFIEQKLKTISFIDVSMPGDITMDVDGTVWINSRNNVVSRLSTSINPDNTIKINKEDFSIGLENALDYVQDYGGIAGDLTGSLLIINNTENSLMYFDTKSPKNLNPKEVPSQILPNTNLKDPNFGSYYYYKTIGDFTGLRWVLKNRLKEGNVPRFLTGVSSLFTVKDSKKNSVVVKKNENYDLTNTLKGYVLQESLFNNNNLFDNFLKPIFNGNGSDLDELGKVVYEKIANYVDNISDVDRCNINSLKSMYNMIGEDLDLFLNTLPPSMRRIIDILSVKRCLLFGNVNTYQSNFNSVGRKFDPKSNIGERLDIYKDYFIPGYPVVLYDNFSKRYRIIYNTIVKEPNCKPFIPYPLSGINYNWGWGLVLDSKNYNYDIVDKFYKIYNFIPSVDNNFYDGLLDLTSDLTTINPNLSSYQDWIGFGGQMDYIIGANLYQNLGLID